MATTKKSRPATRRKTTTSDSEPSTKTTNRSTARSGGASQKRRTNSAKRSTSARRTTSAKRTTSPGTSASRSGASQNGASRNGSSGSASDSLTGSLKSMGGSVVHGMDRAAKPALAVGATAVGIAGGIALRRRNRSTLPFGLPRNGDGIDIIAISKAVGKASARFGQTAKSVSKDIDMAADRAERIGKILS
jgi:hypothetical protein